HRSRSSCSSSPNSLVRPRQSHSLVPAARHECRRAQRRVKDGALAPPPGLSLMHASTTACSRGTGLDTSQLPPINYLGSRPFGSVILLTSRCRRPHARGDVLCTVSGRSHPCPERHAGPAHEGNSRTMSMNADEKSDEGMVPMKQPNKEGSPSAEAVE